MEPSSRFPFEFSSKMSADFPASALSRKAAERLAVIQGAIREIQSRPDLSPEAKERGVRALEKARARLWQNAGGEGRAGSR